MYTPNNPKLILCLFLKVYIRKVLIVKKKLKKKNVRPTDPLLFTLCDRNHTHFFFGLSINTRNVYENCHILDILLFI